MYHSQHDDSPSHDTVGATHFCCLHPLSIKHWRKHGGAPPEGVGAAVGQAAAILRKAQERRQGGFGGRGRFGGRGDSGQGRGDFGRGGRGDFGRGGGFGGRGPGGPPPRTPFGAPGQYGPR